MLSLLLEYFPCKILKTLNYIEQCKRFTTEQWMT